MARVITIDLDPIYRAWRTHLLRYSTAEYFGMVYDSTRQANFPYANLSLVSRATNGSDLEGDEASISLVFETEAYINNNKYLTLYEIDDASASFFNGLGFRRVGDSQIIKVSDTTTKITSRFSMYHYCGYFMREL